MARARGAVDPHAKAEIEWLTGLMQNIRATKAALGAADKTVSASYRKPSPTASPQSTVTY